MDKTAKELYEAIKGEYLFRARVGGSLSDPEKTWKLFICTRRLKSILDKVETEYGGKENDSIQTQG